ncbi:hypothetical protein COU18_02710 [Candidatus Kaiserbacteria bacterium CG10_big_fil_rev_8_21_14_0_10_51_14]|uniref:Baseplate protein J-like domain-containing protein n=1 Tax=Candidatus Kaiserbacteria bacterium CG10_big_fil_rev_8_21_14_0_10_51_14 TaxID=1974610 RepID=A0A2H0UAY6_9BACT|nr:MAG: hypothetical protein COU18_02710 [Candidatus Kaiserbacteria bacterium CG10_big_fil_rev_8_21_14_0_10_51_14]
MTQDYLQDIVSPEDPGFDDKEQQIPIRVNENPAAPPPSRGIRNISVPERTRPSYGAPPRVGDDMRGVPHEAMPPRPPRRHSRLWMWILAALSLVVLAGLALIAFRPTTVTVTPKSQAVTFTDAMVFVAIPSPDPSSTPSTLSYTVHTLELEDSEVVPSVGTTHVETKASGSITVYNNYSSAPVRLIKNTRFETPEGLIFRTPAEIVIPGKSSSAPGQIKVTVFADQPGEKYNVGPVARFNLPGLTSGPMYAGVYAKSTTAMAGGFVGEQPATAPGALNAAIATVRARLETKARESVAREEAGMIALADLASITFQSLPHTEEAGTGVRIHEKAIIEIPMVSKDALGIAVARSLAEEDTVPLTFVPRETLVAHEASSSAPTVGVDSLTFSFTGSGNLVWKVDGAALASALAGRDSTAFQTIVNTFSGIQEAHARIEPFWKKTFPANASDIEVMIEGPETK